METENITISVRLDEDTHNKLQTIAMINNRSMAGEIRKLINKLIDEYENKSKDKKE